MSGYVAKGIDSFEDGEEFGRTQNALLAFQVSIAIESVDDFCGLSDRGATLEGTVSYLPFGKDLAIRNGFFSLFRPDAETGKRHMTYSFGFTGTDGKEYFLYGYKVISDDAGFDAIDDMTKLFTRIHRGSSPLAPLYGSGIVHFQMQSLPSMLTSFEVTGARSIVERSDTAPGPLRRAPAEQKRAPRGRGASGDRQNRKTHLLSRIYERGYRNLAVAEARSTYGVFYTNREVPTVARHISYSERNYHIIDLSLDLEPHTYSGSLGQHYVNREWKAADFRVSFAKNKTHVYAIYTLTLK
jgi:hypothetical protein